MTAVALAVGIDASQVKIIFLLVFLFITNPTAVHAITRAAHDQGIEPWEREEEGDQ
jgi:multicomponent Na+:H+ antiporter subunit G